MRTGYVADVHTANHRRFGGQMIAGINRRCRIILDALGVAVDEAVAHNCTAFTVLGDLFDTSRPEPQVIAATIDVLTRRDGGVSSPRFRDGVRLLAGNHDQVSTEPGDHALGPLARAPGISVISVQRRINTTLCVPFAPQDTEEYLRAAVASFPAPVVCFHAGVSDDETPPFLRGARDSIDVDVLAEICAKSSLAICGNWHNHKIWQRGDLSIVQVGTLAPTGFDNPGLEGYGRMVIHDDQRDEIDVVEIPGPRFIISGCVEEVEHVVRQHGPRHRMFLSLRVSREEIQEARAAVDDWSAKGWLVDGEVIPMAGESAASAATAAHAARGAVSVEESLARYVGGLSLPTGVSAEAVRQRVAGYLGKAR